MSFQIMKKAMIGAAGAVALMGAVSAQAATVNPGLGTYTFAGKADLSQSIFQLKDCDLSLTGDVTQSGNVLTITVTDGSSSGGDLGLCGQVTFGFPWTATIDGDTVGTGDDLSVSLDFQNVDVTGPLGQCGTGNDVVPAIFNVVNPTSAPSASPASFVFAAAIGSNCSVSGTLEDVSSTLEITNP